MKTNSIPKWLFPIFSFLVLVPFVNNSYFPTNTTGLSSSANMIRKNSRNTSAPVDNLISFSFGDEIVLDSNVFPCTMSDNLDIEGSFAQNGSITAAVSLPANHTRNMTLFLPKGDGQITITLVFKDKSISRDIFSSESPNGTYAVSSLSKYSAWQLAGNLQYQEKMDNEDVQLTDINPSTSQDGGEEDSSVASRVFMAGRAYGYLKWTDDENVIHPLVGARVKITFSGSYGDVATYTNASGYYDINFSGILSAWLNMESFLHIYAENQMAKITNANGVVYE